MKVHELNVTASPDRKRVGRGIGSGYGKTAGRGTKGQNSRTGGGVRVGFEGGQNPLSQRLPKKRGFAPLNRTVYQPVNLDDLERFADGSVVDADALRAGGLITSALKPTKLLGEGKLTKKLTVKVQAASASALAAATKAGVTIELVPAIKVPSKKSTRPA